MKPLLRRLASFGAIPALSLVTPLLVLPVVSRTAGGEGILAMAVGQSIGGVASVIVALSWPLLGAAVVARSEVRQRRIIYEESLASRFVAFVSLLPLIIGITWLAVSAHLGSAIMAAIALSANGFSATWYYAGVGHARGLVVLEVLPRVGANALAATVLLLGAPLIAYPMLLLMAALSSTVVIARSVLGRLPVLNLRAGLQSIKRSARATAARGVNGLYNAGLTVTVAFAAPAAALTFTATDRVQKSAFNSLSLVPEALVGWVSEAPPETRKSRVAIAGLLDLATALLAAGLVFVMLPFIFAFLYADEVIANETLRTVSAIAVFSLILARGTLLHGVVVRGHETLASTIVMIASALGLPLVGFGAATYGVTGALAGVAVAEAVVCASSLGVWLFKPDVIDSTQVERSRGEDVVADVFSAPERP